MRSSRAADTEIARAELAVGELAHGGEGVAIAVVKGERRAVFVRGALPGERISADVDFASRPARGKLVEILEASADRTVPPCPHAATCGGCDWMHITRISQPNFHASIVRAHLPSGWRHLPITAHVASEGLRTRARLHLRADKRGRVAVGFFGAASHDIAEVNRCMALDPALDAARASLSDLLQGARGEGEAEIALGRVADPDAERRSVLDLTWDRDLPPSFFALTEEATRAGTWQGARVLTRDSRAPAVIGDPTPWIRGGDDLPLRLAPGGFAQAAELGNVALAKRVAELADEAIANRESPNLVELFSGAGNFTVLLARTKAKVVAVESNAASCAAAQANLRDRNLAAKVTTGDADAFAIPSRTDLVVLDPPRAGAKGACEAIVRSKARRVIYVACDPATLGRDLAILEAGSYAPRSIETFEMFPDTSHVETVISLEFVRPRKEKSPT